MEKMRDKKLKAESPELSTWFSEEDNGGHVAFSTVEHTHASLGLDIKL